MTMAWCFEDEASGYADSVLSRLSESDVLVPALWPLEVANVLLVAERRGRLAPADSARFLHLVGALPIVIDTETSRRAFTDIFPLARLHGLSSYDAAYLELAMRQGVSLATLDDRLRQAAVDLGISVLE